MMLPRFLLAALLAPILLISANAVAADSATTGTDDKSRGVIFIPRFSTNPSQTDGRRDDGRDVDGDLRGNGVDGFLSVGRGTNQTRMVLDYVYAIREPQLGSARRADERTTLVRVSGSRVVLYLTDAPIPEEALGDVARIQALASSGAIRGLELVFDPALKRKKPIWTGRILLGGGNANQVFRTRLGGRNFQLKNFDITGRQLEGSIFIGRAFPQFDSKGERTGDKASFKVEFRAQIDDAPRPTNTLDQRRAGNTPQAEVLLSAVQALRERNIDKFKSLTASNSELAFRVEGPGKDAFRRDLLRSLPQNPEALRRTIDRIVFFGDRAFMVTKTGSGGGREFIFIREDGQWKLSQG
jgi:hypothetical protein